MESKYSSLVLKPPDVFDDLVHIFLVNAFDSGHIPKFPIVDLNTLLNRKMKTEIIVVIGFINL